jgi:hypothetical protein
MTKIIAVSLALTLTGCVSGSEIYGQFGVGDNKSPRYSDTIWIGEDNLGCHGEVGYRHPFTKRLYGGISASHFSQCDLGKPFNEEEETASEHFYMNLEYRWTQ